MVGLVLNYIQERGVALTFVRQESDFSLKITKRTEVKNDDKYLVH